MFQLIRKLVVFCSFTQYLANLHSPLHLSLDPGLILASLKRLEAGRHFNKVRLDDSDPSSDTDCDNNTFSGDNNTISGCDNPVPASRQPTTIDKNKSFDFSKFVKK